MNEKADAPRIVGAPVDISPGGPSHSLAKARIEHIVEFAPVPRAALDRASREGDGPDIRRLSHQEDTLLRPVRDGIHSPAFEPAMGDLGKVVGPILAVLAQEIGPAEIVRAIRTMVLVISVRGPGASAVERRKGRTILRQPLPVMLAVADGRIVALPHAVDAVRPEQPPFRIDQPPLTLVFHDAEKAGRFELRPGGPAAVLIAVRRAGMRGEVFLFRLAMCNELFQRVRLARPVPVDVLTEFVDEGTERPGVDKLDLAAGANVSDLDGVIDARFAYEDKDLSDVRRIELAGMRRRSSHAD